MNKFEAPWALAGSGRFLESAWLAQCLRGAKSRQIGSCVHLPAHSEPLGPRVWVGKELHVAHP